MKREKNKRFSLFKTHKKPGQQRNAQKVRELLWNIQEPVENRRR